jgi:hypothetical protein
MARYHQSPYLPLSQTLPPNDPFLLRLPLDWQVAGSAYWPGFNEVARLVGRLGGDSLILNLRLFQGLMLLALVATALLTHAATRDRRSAALVLFCPLSVIEGTVSAHNDALLALFAAAFAAALVRGRGPNRVAALVAGLTIKASGALLLGFGALEWGLRRAARRRPQWVRARFAFTVAVPCLMGFLAVLVALRDHSPAVRLVSAMIGSPSDAIEHCTRSIECIPRAIVHWGLGLAPLAWAIGLLFRLAGGLWLFYVAWRASHEGERRVLGWAAVGLFVYYLWLHGYMQSWYLLSLLPLEPHAPARLRPAMKVFLFTAVLYYGVRLPVLCAETPTTIAVRELIEGLVVIIPPTVMMVRAPKAR